MINSQFHLSWHAKTILGLLSLLIIKTLALILWEYRYYFPPDLIRSDFLVHHVEHFGGIYRFAFYAHILSAPLSIGLFTILSSRILRPQPRRQLRTSVHAILGYANLAMLLIVFCPSSIFMAFYSFAGPIAGSSFLVSTLALVWCLLQGWKLRHRCILMHARWMGRAFIILLSAVTLRILGGITETLNLAPLISYQISAWLSWTIPLIAFEIRGFAISRQLQR